MNVPLTPDSSQWSPTSWTDYQAVQQAQYPDAEALQAVLDQLSYMPPLVTSWEIMALRKQFADAVAGRKFVLQGGDCAESFADCTPDIITNLSLIHI